MSMSLVISQIIVILLYVAVGFMAGKAKLILPEQRKYLTMLCSNLFLPFTLLSATSRAVDGAAMAGMAAVTGFMFALQILVTAASLLYHRMRGASQGMTAVTTSLLAYSNCTFLGLPLCRALFGDIALIYNASMLIAFNVLFFTIQYSLFTGRVELKNLLTPSMLSTAAMVVMLALGLHFPAPVQTVLSGVGSMVTPLTLMIIGVMLSESNLIEVLGEKRSYIVTLLRNLAIPLTAMLFMRLLPIDSNARLCVLVYAACPCATLTSIYAIKCDMEPEFCAHAVLMSTICFAVTLPLIIFVGQAYL